MDRSVHLVRWLAGGVVLAVILGLGPLRPFVDAVLVDESGVQLLPAVLPAVVPIVGLLLVIGFWNRFNGSASGVQSVTVPSQPSEWRADVRGLLESLRKTLSVAEPPIDDHVRRDLVPPDTHLQRYLERAPAQIEDRLVTDLHAFEVRCRTVALGTCKLTGLVTDADTLDWLDTQYDGLMRRLGPTETSTTNGC